MLTHEKSIIELKKRKLSIIYGRGGTGKSTFIEQLQSVLPDPLYGLNLQEINCHNFLPYKGESYTSQFFHRLNLDWNQRSLKNEYYALDNFSGLYFTDMIEWCNIIKQWSTELQKNQHLYIISTDKTVVNCFPIEDCFFTYKMLTAKEENDGVQYLVEYYREGVDYWEEVCETRLSNYDCYEHLGWLLEDIINEQQSGGGNVAEASKRYFSMKYYLRK